jgi:hypothetical protein
MAVQHKWKLDRKLTAMMVEDMLFDPILAAKVLLRVKLPPHEELRIMWMWTTYYTNDDSGFSTGKSWTAALISALRSMLMPGRVSGIISKTFAQGKLVFANFDRWYGSSPIYRSCIKHEGGKKRLVHGTDVWVAYYRGGSETRVLPPNFLNDAERIRSERWHDAYLDEWTTYGNFKALNTTIIGRVTNVNHFPDCPVRQNHVHLMSTPAFQHHPAYKMIKSVDMQVSSGNKNYGRFSCNYRHIPKTEEWKWLVNKKIIFHMQTNLPSGVVKSEVDGVWSKDSSTYYNSSIVERARLKIVPVVTRRSSSSEIFICGFDTARGGNDSTSAGQGDDFAMSVFRMNISDMMPHHVLTVRKSKITDIQMSGIIHKWHRILGFTLVVFDPGGGGLFVKDRLRNSTQLIDNNEIQVTPIIQITDTSGVIGDTILVPFSRSDLYISQMWGKMSSESVLVNRMHEEFKGAIENKKVILSGEWNGWKNNESAWDVDGKREWLNRHGGLEDIEKIKAEMDLAVSQLVHVDYKRDEEGNAIIDSYGMFNFKSKSKKDAAYSLCYSFIGTRIYSFLRSSGFIEGLSADNENIEGPVFEEI